MATTRVELELTDSELSSILRILQNAKNAGATDAASLVYKLMEAVG